MQVRRHLLTKVGAYIDRYAPDGQAPRAGRDEAGHAARIAGTERERHGASLGCSATSTRRSAFCLRRLDDEDADDVSAEVFITTWDRLADDPAAHVVDRIMLLEAASALSPTDLELLQLTSWEGWTRRSSASRWAARPARRPCGSTAGASGCGASSIACDPSPQPGIQSIDEHLRHDHWSADDTTPPPCRLAVGAPAARPARRARRPHRSRTTPPHRARRHRQPAHGRRRRRPRRWIAATAVAASVALVRRGRPAGNSYNG